MKLNKPFIFWIAFSVSDFIFLFVLIFTNFNTNILITGIFALGVLSLIAILTMNGINSRVKWGLVLSLPFKYFIMGIFGLLIPFFGESIMPAYVFAGFYLACLIGAPILLMRAMTKKVCPQCGHETLPTMTFCAKCGCKFEVGNGI